MLRLAGDLVKMPEPSLEQLGDAMIGNKTAAVSRQHKIQGVEQFLPLLPKIVTPRLGVALQAEINAQGELVTRWPEEQRVSEGWRVDGTWQSKGG